MTAPVIGLGGRLRAGKDVVADHLVKEHGFVKIGMSDALHEAVLALNPIIFTEARAGFPDKLLTYRQAIEQFGYTATKANFPEARRLLQALGTEVGRDMIGENTWVNITARKVDDHLYADQPVVITGIRFTNELKMVNQFAGRTWWIERPDEQADPAIAAHASENGVQASQFDHILENTGSISDLLAKARALL